MENMEGSTKLERAAKILRAAIIQGDLKPGQKLVQQELAELLGMSSTPVREVLRILETEGLLVYVPYKGVFVAEVSVEETEEIIPIRVALEGLAVRQSVPNLGEDQLAELETVLDEMEQAWKNMDLAKLRRDNYRFHSTIYRACGSEILCSMIERLWPMFDSGKVWIIPNRAQQTLREHRQILDAVRERNVELAEKLLADHIASAGRTIVDFSKRQSHEVFG